MFSASWGIGCGGTEGKPHASGLIPSPRSMVPMVVTGVPIESIFTTWAASASSDPTVCRVHRGIRPHEHAGCEGRPRRRGVLRGGSRHGRPRIPRQFRRPRRRGDRLRFGRALPAGADPRGGRARGASRGAEIRHRARRNRPVRAERAPGVRPDPRILFLDQAGDSIRSVQVDRESSWPSVVDVIRGADNTLWAASADGMVEVFDQDLGLLGSLELELPGMEEWNRRGTSGVSAFVSDLHPAPDGSGVWVFAFGVAPSVSDVLEELERLDAAGEEPVLNGWATPSSTRCALTLAASASSARTSWTPLCARSATGTAPSIWSILQTETGGFGWDD